MSYDMDILPNGKICPNCESEDVEWGLVWWEDEQEWVEHCHCFDCKHEWDE